MHVRYQPLILLLILWQSTCVPEEGSDKTFACDLCLLSNLGMRRMSKIALSL